ncbi:MAG: GntR family transcriptional regulator [Chloroflexi bacterium]|nr:GntR family transcriptional regulator [Chloroflexota bacterium]
MAAEVETTREPAAVTRFEAAHRRLRDEIQQGVYAPRERLVEVDVAEHLGISRSTLRAVLVRLAQEGLIELEANRGARVKSFTLELALHVLEARGALEGVVASNAARHATDPEIQQLTTIVDAMAAAAADDDLPRYSRLNGHFHRCLLEISRNPEVRRLLESLHLPLVRYQFRTILVPGRKIHSLDEHRRILACVARRDPAGAERAAREHIANVQATLQSNAALLTF